MFPVTENNRIVWSEGLFLRPHHFQQQERFLEAYVGGSILRQRPHAWGFTELEIERDMLAIGRFGLRRACGMFPDGTPFAIPDDDPLPAPLEVGPMLRDQIVHLAIPLRKAGTGRFKKRVHQARDVNTDSSDGVELQVAALNTRIVVDGEPYQDFARIPLAHIIECRADNSVVLDDLFIPTVLRSAVSPRLATFLQELHGLLHQRGEALAARAVATGRGGAAEIADFLMLQAVNRYEPVIAQLAADGHVHPEDLHRLLLEITGDLSTLTTTARRPAPLAAYRHDALRESFDSVIVALRTLLSVVLEQNAVPIPIAQKKYGISIASVFDRSLFDEAVFVLAARADVPAEEFRKLFPVQMKIGPAERIRDLVNLQLPGVPVRDMAVAPRQIPYHAGFVYFELDRTGEMWRTLKSSGALALHLAGEFPGLQLEMWAIRG
jgi:type VI secretion system protein ImpJ